MEPNGIKCEFSSKAYHYSTSADMVGWTIVSLSKELSAEIRESFKREEQGWGRLKATAKTGGSEWQTAIWFDTKLDTYMLPIKAAIRKKENIALEQVVDVAIWI